MNQEIKEVTTVKGFKNFYISYSLFDVLDFSGITE